MKLGCAPAPRPVLLDDADPDRAFDSVYPGWVQRQSERHWTPVEVAKRAAELLVTGPSSRVLDVGSGAGKFCIVGALTTPRGTFCGVEQRAELVAAAREASRQYGVERRVRLLHGSITAIDWRQFDAFYFYNPFFEPVSAAPNVSIAESCVRFTRAQLAAAPPGTRVVTYYGFGGKFPPDYRCVRREGRGAAFLELWIKQPRSVWVPPLDLDVEQGARRYACARAGAAPV